MYKSYKVLFLLLFFIASAATAQNVFFIYDESNVLDNDGVLVDWLTAEGYTVTEATDDEMKSEFYFDDEITAHDFVVVSESVGSGNISQLKGLAIPVVSLEMWASKWDVFGWVPNNTSGTYYENSTENTIRILDGSHPLAAGFATDAEIDIVDGTDDVQFTNYSNPQVEHIPVAELITSTPEQPQLVVFGIEEGTWLYQAQDTDPDGSVIAGARIAGVGISFNANNYITDDGYTILRAAVSWVTGGATAIEDDLASPVTYELNQNYPNPFNPSTQISFTLKQNGHTTLKVYDALGKEVATLMDAEASQGTHIVNFDAANLNSGVYFYQLVSGDYKETRKMMLIE